MREEGFFGYSSKKEELIVHRSFPWTITVIAPLNINKNYVSNIFSNLEFINLILKGVLDTHLLFRRIIMLSKNDVSKKHEEEMLEAHYVKL